MSAGFTAQSLLQMHMHHSQFRDSPQHQALCVESTPQVCVLPTLRSVKSKLPPTRTGVDESDVAPLPSWPLAPVPQHTTACDVSKPHACNRVASAFPLVYTLVKL